MPFKIKEIRTAFGYTQEDLTCHAGLSCAAIAASGIGATAVTTTQTLTKIADALGKKVRNIFLAQKSSMLDVHLHNKQGCCLMKRDEGRAPKGAESSPQGQRPDRQASPWHHPERSQRRARDRPGALLFTPLCANADLPPGHAKSNNAVRSRYANGVAMNEMDAAWYRACMSTGLLDADFCLQQIEKYNMAQEAWRAAYVVWN